MKIAVLILFAAICLCVLWLGMPMGRAQEVAELSVAQRKTLAAGPGEVVKGLKGMDPAVRAALFTVLPEDGLADVGGAFSVGCEGGPGEKFERLLLAGRVAETWFAAYERGGAAYNRSLLVFARDERGRWRAAGRTDLPWHGTMSRFEDLQKALEAPKP